MASVWVLLLAAGTLSCAPPSLRSALLRLGLRGQQLERLAAQPASASQLRTLELSLEQLDGSGASAREVAEILRRQPRILGVLCAREPAPFFRALHRRLGIAQPLPLLQAEPRLLSLDETRLEEAIAYLEPYVGASRLADFVLAQPQALLWRDDGSTPIACLLREIGMTEAAIKRAQADFPAVVRLSSSANAERTLAYLRAEAGLTQAQLCKLVSAFPQLLGLSLEQNVRPTLHFLQENGLSPPQLLLRAPTVLGFSVEENLRPSIAFLRSLGINLPKALDKHPQLLGLSIEGKLKPTVAFLREQGMCELGAALSSQPSILSLSLTTNLRPKFEFLRAIGVEDLGAQLDAYPALLTLSLETNLRPSAAALTEALHLREQMGLKPQKLRPRHLAASLDARILPRLRFCKERGCPPTLHGITTASDALFCKQGDCSPEEWERWLEEHRRERDGGGGLDIPWLPDSVDLTKLLLEGVEAPQPQREPQADHSQGERVDLDQT